MPIDEDPRLLDVARFAERPAQLGEADLDLGVPADALDAALAEHLAHEVGRTTRDADEAVIVVGSRAVARNGGLEEVPEAVQLMSPFEVGPARALTGSAEARVEVAVGLLRRGDAIDDATEPRLQLGGASGFAARRDAGAGGIRFTIGEPCGRRARATQPPDLPGDRLEVLVHLGVGELAAAPALGQRASSREIEVAEPALAFEPALDVIERRRAVDGLSATPDAARDGDLIDPERAQRARRRCDRSDGRRPRGAGRVGGVAGEGHGHPLNAPDMKPRT